MKKLIGLSGIVIIGIAAASLAEAAPRDALYVGLPLPRVVLSAGQKTSLRGFVAARWPSASAANVDALVIRKDKMLSADGKEITINSASLFESVSLTDDEFADALIAGSIRPGQVDPALINKEHPAYIFNAVDDAALSSLTQSLFGLPQDQIFMLRIFRDRAGVPSRVVAVADPIKSADPAAFKAAFLAGEVQRPLDRVK
jgi:hypothetical protein